MRKAAMVLTVLAAAAFLLGSVNAFFGNYALRVAVLAQDPETWWRGAVGLLLFAMTLLMLELPARRG